MSLSATYDSRMNDMESLVVARGDLWRAEVSQHSGGSGGSSASPRGGGDGASLLLVQLGLVLFVPVPGAAWPFPSGTSSERSALGVPGLLVSSEEMVLHVHGLPEPICRELST